MKVGIVGLGEVGAAMAEALRRIGHEVCCLDTRQSSGTRARAHALGIVQHSDPDAFASAADIVVVVVQARRAEEVASLLVPRLRPGTAYLDATAKPVPARDAIGERCRGHDIPFTDVAIADTVSLPDRSVDLLVSGAATDRVVALFAGTRFKPRVVDASRPVSAELKLLRSVFTKGLTAVLLETLTASEKCGVRAEVQRSILAFMEAEFGGTAEMLVGSSIKHAGRRADEMEDVGAMVKTLLGSATMTAATAAVLREIADAGIRSEAASLDGVIRELVAANVFGSLAPQR